MKIRELLEGTSSLEKEFFRYEWALKELRYSPDSEDLAYMIKRSNAIGIDHRIIIAIVAAESSFRSDIIHQNGNSSDYGYFQLNNLWHDQHKGNIKAHIDAGIDHYKWCLKTEKGNVNKALSRYNTGGSVSDAGKSYASYVNRVKTKIDSKAKKFKDVINI